MAVHEAAPGFGPPLHRKAVVLRGLALEILPNKRGAGGPVERSCARPRVESGRIGGERRGVNPTIGDGVVVRLSGSGGPSLCGLNPNVTEGGP